MSKRKHVFIVALLVSVTIWIVLIVSHGKLSASHHWFGVPVWVYSLVAFIGTLFIGLSTKWVRDPWFETSYVLLVIVVIGLILSASLGIRFTEPRERSLAYDYRSTPAGGWYYGYYPIFDVVDSSSGSSDVDIDDDALAVIAILLVVVAVVLGSAFIPHFWVVATTICLALMVLFAYRSMINQERY